MIQPEEPRLIVTEAAPGGRREAGKEERRQRIIQAARELIRETNTTGLSMRELARRAGVSLATPYNLFGSKGAIVLAVMQDVRDYRERFFSGPYADPVARIFDAVDLAIEFYLRDPEFYKVLWREIFSATGDVRSAIYNPKRDAFWLGLIEDAVAAGAIGDAVDPVLLLHQLDHQFRSVMLDWVTGALPSPALSPTIWLGYALMLLGAATPGWRGPLEIRVAQSQQRMQAAGVQPAARSVLPA
jgi:AcrR family transcriptional regulator